MGIRWKNSYTCNISEIDRQHIRLFEISSKLNILEPICTRIDFEYEILEVINELKEYAIYHFDYEEQLMQRYKFNDIEKHHYEHETFVNRVIELEKVRFNNTNPDMIRSMIDFVDNWITAHILKEDMKYKDYFNNQGILVEQ